MKRTLALLLALCLCLSLTACGGDPAADATPTPVSGGTESAPPTQTPQGTEDLIPPPSDKLELLEDNATDVAQQLLGYPNTTTMMTVEGTEVSAEDFLYWVASLAYAYSYNAMYYGVSLDFSEEVEDGVTWNDRVKDDARKNCALLALTPTLARELGVSLTAADMDQVAEKHAEDMVNAGTNMGVEDARAAYAYQLQGMGINDSAAYAMDETIALYNKVKEAWMQAHPVTDGAFEVYVKDQDILRAKHILLMTVDPETREPLSEEEKAAKKTQAENLLSELRGAEDPVALFDELMEGYSEDTGLAAYPDGYTFSAGEMVAEFENGTRALKYGQISDIIESSYGYHIILRLAPGEDIRTEAGDAAFNDMLEARIANTNITTTEQYNALVPGDYYNDLLDFQSTLTRPGADLQPAD